MVDFLFGWITKPKMELTFIDDVVCATELLLLIILIGVIFKFMMNRGD